MLPTTKGTPTSPLGTQSIKRILERYAVRKGLVRNTQQSCYIVSRRLISHLKSAFSITKCNNHDTIRLSITLTFCAFT